MNSLNCKPQQPFLCSHADEKEHSLKTLPKALQTQALTALTSNFGLVGLVQHACLLGRLSLIWFGRFGLAGLVWIGRFCLVGLAWFGWFG